MFSHQSFSSSKEKNMRREKVPYGSWRSKISSESIVQAGIGLSELFVDPVQGHVYWIESRPMEEGRYVVVTKNGDTIREISPKDTNVRTRVHEYGGAPAIVYDGISNIFYTLAYN